MRRSLLDPLSLRMNIQLLSGQDTTLEMGEQSRDALGSIVAINQEMLRVYSQINLLNQCNEAITETTRNQWQTYVKCATYSMECSDSENFRDLNQQSIKQLTACVRRIQAAQQRRSCALSDVQKAHIFDKQKNEEAEIGSDEEIFAESNHQCQDLHGMKLQIEEKIKAKEALNVFR